MTGPFVEWPSLRTPPSTMDLRAFPNGLYFGRPAQKWWAIATAWPDGDADLEVWADHGQTGALLKLSIVATGDATVVAVAVQVLACQGWVVVGEWTRLGSGWRAEVRPPGPTVDTGS